MDLRISPEVAHIALEEEISHAGDVIRELGVQVELGRHAGIGVKLCSGSLSSLSWGGPGSDNADSVTSRTR